MTIATAEEVVVAASNLPLDVFIFGLNSLKCI